MRPLRHSIRTAVAASAQIPHLEKRGAATQLIVDGKPWLALAGETDNTASSSLEYMETAWPKIVKANLNTVLVGIGWDWVEPEEGKYDFTLVDGLLDGARKHNLRLIFLWFAVGERPLELRAGVGESRQQRFPRARLKTASRWKCYRHERGQPQRRHPRLYGLPASSEGGGLRAAHGAHDSVAERSGT